MYVFFLKFACPNIMGELGRILFADNTIDARNALKKSYSTGELQKQNASYYGCAAYAKFDASDSNSIYGKSTNVQPPSLAFNYIVKY